MTGLTDVADPSHESSAQGPPSVLVVEDDEVHAQLLVSELERGGKQVIFASDSLTALAYLCQKKFDLVILDSPVSRRFEVEPVPEQDQRLLEEALKNSLVVVVVSGGLTDEEREQVKGLGVREVIAKPFSVRKFHRRVDELLADAQDQPAASVHVEWTPGPGPAPRPEVFPSGLPDTLPTQGAIALKLEQGLPVFRASDAVQRRVEELLEKNRADGLSEAEEQELNQYEDLDGYLSWLNRLARNQAKQQGGIGVP